MNYKLPELDLSSEVFLFCGNGKRKATATDVIFIDTNLLIISSLLGRKIYLVDISNQQFNIVFETDCDGYVDLMDYKNGVLCASNAKHRGLESSCSLFKIENNKILPLKTIQIDKNVRIHGCLFIDDENIILGSNDESLPGLYFFNIKSEKIYKSIRFETRIKDFCLYNDTLLVIGSETSPSINEIKVKKSILYQCNFETFELINTLELEGQVDAICISNNDCFVTLQCEHSVAHIKIIENKPILMNYIKGFDFPHGIDTKYGKVCVTNYGTNSVDIVKINELI